jgi:hypothetical protein
MSQERLQVQVTLFDSAPDGIGTAESPQGQIELSHGEFWTLSISEWPNEDDVFTHTSLSEQVLSETQHESFYLSREACLGILDRGSRNGMTLDPTLEKALRRQAEAS